MDKVMAQDPVIFDLVGDDKFRIQYNSPLLKDHIMDHRAVPEEKRPGQMRKLLCASAAGCLSGSLYNALTNRGVQIESLKASAVAFGANEIGALPRIQAIHIKVEVGIDEKDSKFLEEVKNDFKEGCLITRSISPGIQVTHSIDRI